MENWIFWPSNLAIAIASVPDKKNLNDNSKKGGASIIEILAEVNALDQIKANVSPRRISRIFIYLYYGLKKAAIEAAFNILV
mgnify:CR=1 FL=1